MEWYIDTSVFYSKQIFQQKIPQKQIIEIHYNFLWKRYRISSFFELWKISVSYETKSGRNG